MVTSGGQADTVTLWRVLDPSSWRVAAARLPEQPIFYPVLNRGYVTTIARDWNVRHSGAGFVTRFEVLPWPLGQDEVH
jgi:hypothetical protein